MWVEREDPRLYSPLSEIAWGESEATSDDRGRVRIPMAYARHLREGLQGPSKESAAPVIMASLNKVELMVWAKRDFFEFRNWMIQQTSGEKRLLAREFLRSVQIQGDESQVDKQERLLIPRKVRVLIGMQEDSDQGDIKPCRFNIINDGYICLTPIAFVKHDLTGAQEHPLVTFAWGQYFEYLASLKAEGAS